MREADPNADTRQRYVSCGFNNKQSYFRARGTKIQGSQNRTKGIKENKNVTETERLYQGRVARKAKVEQTVQHMKKRRMAGQMRRGTAGAEGVA